MKQRKELEFGGLANSLDESKTPANNCYSCANVTTDRGIIEGIGRYTQIAQRSANSNDVAYGLGYGKFSGNEVQRVALAYTTLTAGTFTLTFSGQTTAGIAYNASADDVQAALEALSNINVGDIRVTGGPFPSLPVRVEFRGQYANTDAANMTINTGSLTGTGISGTVTEEFKGGSFEQYVMVAKASGDTNATLYKITSTDGFLTSGNTTVTSLGVTNLNAGNWFFEQYGRYIYGVNSTDGVIRIALGGSVVQDSSKPKSPSRAPTRLVKFSWSIIGGSPKIPFGSTVTTSGFASAPSFAATSGVLAVTLAAAETNAEVSLTITLTATKNYQFNDWGSITLDRSEGGLAIPPESVALSLINNAAEEIDASIYGRENNVDTGASLRTVVDFQMLGVDRQKRDDITKVTLRFRLTGTSGKKIYISGIIADNWMADDQNVNMANGPKSGRLEAPLEYAYSYYDVSDDLESALSPSLQSWFSTPDKRGHYMRLTMIGSSALSGSDKIRLYRRERNTGKWRRLPNTDGTYGITNVTSGTTTFDDHYMEYELAEFPEPDNPLGFPPADSGDINPDCVAFWKQSLVFGAKRQAWQSRVGFPTSFLPSPDDDFVLDANLASDIYRPVTEYVSDNRAEEIYAMVGQDSFYAVTPISAYAKVGDTPASAAAFRRLPGSRGTAGRRGVSRFGGGVLIGSQDGLWYYAVGRGFSGDDNGALAEREETDGVRTSWASLIGSDGSALVVIEFNDEIWAVNGTSYMVNTRNRKWYAGTFTHSMKAAWSNRERGLMMLTTTGKLMRFGTATSDNGTSVNWTYTTGILIGQRVRVVGFECECSGAPTVTITTDDGAGGTTVNTAITLSASRQMQLSVNLPPARSHKLAFAGVVGTDSIKSFTLLYEDMGDGFGG